MIFSTGEAVPLTIYGTATHTPHIGCVVSNRVHVADGRGFESHPRQLFSLKINCLGRVVLCCLAFLSEHLMDD